ncbi:ParA family protein [Spirulina major CS-329]|uniref:ParA family protein n=1 Tax=Spirulina TaxID=1154 RepID=UPI00232D0140|nr:ParA family protein [Spirulina major]MDB9502426.1 ParA family protein [Spirulina major CS-329]
MLKIAVFNFKGGTGKTTTVLNLGACLAAAKRRVLLLDLDGQRTLSYGLRCDGEAPTTLDLLRGDEADPLPTPTKYLALLPGDIGLFQLQADHDLFTPALAAYDDRYDLALLDCPPGLNVASTQALLTSDRILIPIVGEPAALKGLSEAVQLIRGDRPDVPIDVVRCRYKSQLVMAKQADELLEAGSTELGYTLLKTVIPENVSVAEAIAPQLPVIDYAPRSTGAKAYKHLAKECLALWPTLTNVSK